MRKINPNKFAIDIRNFTRVRKIDSGGFGEVYLAQYLKTGENVAAKVLKRDVTVPQNRKLVDNEIDIMRSIDHPSIIKFFGFSLQDFNQENNVTIFMEFAKNHSLDDALDKCRKSNRPKGYDNTTRQIILIGIASAMKYLHKHCIIHRDLKPNNVLLNDELQPLLIDFGTAKFFDRKRTMDQSQHCGTLSYMAPEVISGLRYNWKVDIYSFAILMYEVVTESDPYPDLEKTDSAIKDLKHRVANYRYRPYFRTEVKSTLKNLIEKCWSHDPTDRPNFDEIFDKLITTDYFLDDVDVKKIRRYVDLITKDDEKNDPKAEELKKRTMTATKEYELVKSANNQLKNDNEYLREQISNLRSENQQLTANIQQLTMKLEAVSKRLAMFERGEQYSLPKSEYQIIKPPISHEAKIEEQSIRSPRDPREDNTMSRTPPRYPPRERREDNTACKTPQRSAQSAREKRDDRQFMKPLQMPSRKEEDSFARTMVKIQKDDDLSTRSSSRRERKEPDNFARTMVKIQRDDDLTTKSPSVKERKESDNFGRSIIRIQRDEDLTTRSPSVKERKEPDNFARTMVKISIPKDDEIPLKSSLVKDRKETDNLSKSLTKIQIPKEKLDEEMLAKLPPLRKVKSDDVSPKSLTSSITIAEFNSYPLQLQQSFISKIITSSAKDNIQYFTSVNNLLIYILQFVTTNDATNFLEINSENPEDMLEQVDLSDGINLLSNATELLYYNKSLDSAEFNDIISDFTFISFELKYLSKYFSGSYRIISDLWCNEIYINIFISGPKKTDNTFKGNQMINSVKIDYSVTSIGDYAFKGCSSLTQVSIPSSVTSIGSGSFEGCSSLKEISIPSSVASIGFCLCKGCSSLTQVSLLYSLKLIRSNAFYGCSSLKEVTIPSSVTSIGDYAFYGCSSLTEVTVPSSVTSIGQYAFSNCTSLSEITIPSSVNSIGKGAFDGCSALKRIKIPTSFDKSSLGLHSSVNVTRE
ncbi:hypothetical protein M9Y10_005840 [Tritrichomonas musculus]|uniref:Protein kinase domain-containing protein n=1 Tax=Tritrichomonas musculus TaxID=1915356 RepID=A0ABR2JE17_9EUKA